SPCPTSTTPAFSPGPCRTRGPFVGKPLRKRRLDLYEQCSLHIAEKMSNSTRLGSRPSTLRRRAYSSCERPCAATISGVIEAIGLRRLPDGRTRLRKLAKRPEIRRIDPRGRRRDGAGTAGPGRGPAAGPLGRLAGAARLRGARRDRAAAPDRAEGDRVVRR